MPGFWKPILGQHLAGEYNVRALLEGFRNRAPLLFNQSIRDSRIQNHIADICIKALRSSVPRGQTKLAHFKRRLWPIVNRLGIIFFDQAGHIIVTGSACNYWALNEIRTFQLHMLTRGYVFDRIHYGRPQPGFRLTPFAEVLLILNSNPTITEYEIEYKIKGLRNRMDTASYMSNPAGYPIQTGTKAQQRFTSRMMEIKGLIDYTTIHGQKGLQLIKPLWAKKIFTSFDYGRVAWTNKGPLEFDLNDASSCSEFISRDADIAIVSPGEARRTYESLKTKFGKTVDVIHALLLGQEPILWLDNVASWFPGGCLLDVTKLKWKIPFNEFQVQTIVTAIKAMVRESKCLIPVYDLLASLGLSSQDERLITPADIAAFSEILNIGHENPLNLFDSSMEHNEVLGKVSAKLQAGSPISGQVRRVMSARGRRAVVGLGESPTHRQLKVKVASDPSLLSSLGLKISKPAKDEDIEHRFNTTDEVDILFHTDDGKIVVVEIEPEIFATYKVPYFQAGKYAALASMEYGVPPADVIPVVIATKIDKSLATEYARQGIRSIEIKL